MLYLVHVYFVVGCFYVEYIVDSIFWHLTWIKKGASPAAAIWSKGSGCIEKKIKENSNNKKNTRPIMSFGFRNNYQIKERQFFSLLHPPWIVAAKTTDLIQKLFFFAFLLLHSPQISWWQYIHLQSKERKVKPAFKIIIQQLRSSFNNFILHS